MFYIFLLLSIKFIHSSSKNDDLYPPPSAPYIEHLQASTSRNEEQTIYLSILDQCSENSELHKQIEKFFSIYSDLKKQNDKLIEENIFWQKSYWELWSHNYVIDKVISADQNGIVHLRNTEMDENFMEFVLHGRMVGRQTILLYQELEFQKYYFDDMLLRIALTELPQIVMDLHVRLPNSFKCPDACFILSGFVDTLSFREIFPHCTDDEFVQRSMRAKIKAIGHRALINDDDDDGEHQGDPWIGFLIENANGAKFEVQLHYSPSNCDKWSKMVISRRQLVDSENATTTN